MAELTTMCFSLWTRPLVRGGLGPPAQELGAGGGTKLPTLSCLRSLASSRGRSGLVTLWPQKRENAALSVGRAASGVLGWSLGPEFKTRLLI